MEVAFSPDVNEIIDAEMAYDYYWSGLIHSNCSFQCPSEDCNAKVTCININKPRQDMKQTPNFRGYHHIDNCPYSPNYDYSKNEYPQGTENAFLDATIKDTFLLERPQKKESDAIQISEIRNRKDNNNYSGAKYYSLKSVVSKWLRYRKENLLSEMKIKIGNQYISYEDLFKGVYNQNLDNLPDTPRIYWGTAYFDRNEKIPGYSIRFENSFISNKESIRPSFLLRDDQIENYIVKRLLSKRIEEISNNQSSKGFAFIYGKPYLVEKNSRRFINFSLKNLDHMEIRYLELFELL